jgi:Coenzyme F390 synthetase
VGVPPQMLALSRHRLAGSLARSLRTMLLSGDVADGRLVAELEKNLPGCRVYRHYGLTEVGLGGAVECGQRAGPHLRDDIWAEILDPASGRPVSSPGQAGEITLTPLTRRGMPLIRYRTGDEGRLRPEPCACGSILPRLEVFGRLADCFSLPSGRRLRVADLEAPLMALPFVRGYDLKLHLKCPKALSVLLIAAPETSEADLRTTADSVARWLGPDAKGLTLAVELKRREAAEPAEGLPARTSGGKRRLLHSDDPPAGPLFRY